MSDLSTEQRAEAAENMKIDVNSGEPNKRLEDAYKSVEGSRDAKKFEAQGGLAKEESKEVKETMESIQQARQERAQEKTKHREASQSQEMSQ
jgi:hypothetical protein